MQAAIDGFIKFSGVQLKLSQSDNAKVDTMMVVGPTQSPTTILSCRSCGGGGNRCDRTDINLMSDDKDTQYITRHTSVG